MSSCNERRQEQLNSVIVEIGREKTNVAFVIAAPPTGVSLLRKTPRPALQALGPCASKPKIVRNSRRDSSMT